MFGASHCHAGDVASVTGNGDVAVVRPATCFMLEKWRYHHGTLVITCRQRLLKPFKIRNTAFVRFHSSHAWVKVVHTHILQSLSFMLRDMRRSIHRWDNDANAACIKHNYGVGMTDDIPDVPAMVGQIYEDLEKEKTRGTVF